MDSTQVTLLSVEAVGTLGLSQAQAAWSQASTGLEYGQIGARPVATEQKPSPVLRADKQVL